MNRTAIIPKWEIPKTFSPTDVLEYLTSNEKNRDSKKLFTAIKDVSDLTDGEISLILDISPKTFRYYKNDKRILSLRLSEHAIALYALFNHGKEIFGSWQEFENWLNEENYFFGGKAPIKYLQAITGIKFLDDRLTAMEYGDNV